MHLSSNLFQFTVNFFFKNDGSLKKGRVEIKNTKEKEGFSSLICQPMENREFSLALLKLEVSLFRYNEQDNSTDAALFYLFLLFSPLLLLLIYIFHP